MLRVLAIDVGSRNLGWAICSPGQNTSYGTYVAPQTGNDIGLLLADIRGWLSHLLKFRSITDVVFEAPILNPDNDFLIVRKVSAVGGLIELVAYDHNIPVEEKLPGPIRKHFLAPHKVPKKSKEIKDAVMARCRQLGWPTKTSHEADALALADYTLAVKTSVLARKIGELL